MPDQNVVDTAPDRTEAMDTDNGTGQADDGRVYMHSSDCAIHLGKLTSGVNTRWSLRWLLLSLRIVLWRLLLLGRIEPLKRMRDDLMGLEIMLREKHVSLEVPALQERPSCGGGRT